MDIKSLMVGDWVIPHVYDSKLEPSKIVGIHYNSYKGKDYVDWVDCELWDELSLSDIEPIPLERIHLIKNGFRVREDTDDMEFFYNDGYEIKVVFDEGFEIYEEGGELFDKIPSSIYLVIEFAEKDITMPIEYVHELQQAMRIMGCDKGIEL